MQEITFSVELNTNDGETVCLVGDCPELGSWQPRNAVRMIKVAENNDGEIWQVSVKLHNRSSVHYRYFVCVILEHSAECIQSEVIVRRWETHLEPRKWIAGEPKPLEKFGYIDDIWKVESGWLTAESVVQLKFYNNPIQIWKRRYANSQFHIKVTPVDLERRDSAYMMEEDSTEDDHNEHLKHSIVWPFVEVSVMNEEECEFKSQDQFGRVYFPDNFITFNAQMLRPETIAYVIDFYLYEPMTPPGDIPKHIGFCYILPSVLHNTVGTSLIPITGLKQQPIGQLTVEYLVVRPMRFDCDMKVSYSKYWKRGRPTLEVGHRGSGNSYTLCPTHCATVRENTIASLKLAADHGADYVEFDVQLSKDRIPVLYHDFHVCITMKKKRCLKEHDLLEIPVKDLTLDQLHMLKLFHVSVKHQSSDGIIEHGDDEHGNQDSEPFPTLLLALQDVPSHVGFNIEIKWTMQRKDGTFELENPMELNQYLDILLKVLLENAGERRIIISTFHPDICTMIRAKQSKYPILFLTQGETTKWPPYLDTRTSTTSMATYFARSAGILGINVHTEEILRDHTLVKMVKESNMVMFCWGDDNNDPNVIELLRTLGLDGIIYDRINERLDKENVFVMEKKTQKIILNAACIPCDSQTSSISDGSDVSVGSYVP